jgi:hypothetical protein
VFSLIREARGRNKPVIAARVRGKTSVKSRKFALSIALIAAIVNLIWGANEGAQWQSVYAAIRFDGA